MIEFYTNPMSRGQIARWMLEEVEADYNEHVMAYGPEMRTAEFLKINPMGKVPAIVHNGKTVTETPAIVAYLADAFAQKGLSPTSDEQADYYRWFFFASGPFEQAVLAKAMGFEPDSPEREGTVGFGSFDRTISTLDAFLTGREYVVGTRFTAADVYLGSQLDFTMQFGSAPKLPAFEAYVARLRERPAYQKAKARDGELIAAMTQE